MRGSPGNFRQRCRFFPGGSPDCRGVLIRGFVWELATALSVHPGGLPARLLEKGRPIFQSNFLLFFHWKMYLKNWILKSASKIGSEIGFKIGLKIGFAVLRCLRAKIGRGSFFKKQKLDEDAFSRAKNWTRIVPPKKQKLDENCATQ